MPAKKKVESQSETHVQSEETEDQSVEAQEAHRPTQDDLNPAYAPPVDEGDDKDSKDAGDSGDSKDGDK